MSNVADQTERARALRQTADEGREGLVGQARQQTARWSEVSKTQQPIGAYVVDFVTFERRVVIEIDGGHHDELATRGRDEERTAWLEGSGYEVMRFWNSDVRGNPECVLHRISEALR